jgi:hypothetical protein
MNCKTVQRRLLALPNPARVPASVREHLAECRACREMQNHLAQIEQAVPALVVPSSSFAKAALLRKIRQGPTFREKVAQSVEAIPAAFGRMGRWRLAGAGLAAAVLVMLLCWPLFRGPGPTPNNDYARKLPDPDPLLASVLQRQLTLAEAKQTRQQVETLASLAGDLNGAVQGLARTTESRDTLPDVSGWYGLVVHAEVTRFGKLAFKDRKAVVAPLAQDLEKAAKQADALADEVGAPRGDHPLRKLATTAREAKSRLDYLTKQEANAVPPLRRGAGHSMFAMVPPLLLAAAPQDEPDTEAVARRFKRNRDLIELVVKESVKLASVEPDAADESVVRAAACGAVARDLAHAIQLAAAEREDSRVEELAQHLRDQLQRGVAANLGRAGKVKLGSALDKQIQEVIGDVDRAVRPLEEQLQRGGSAQTGAGMQRTLRTVLDGRAEIDKVLKRDEEKP